MTESKDKNSHKFPKKTIPHLYNVGRLARYLMGSTAQAEVPDALAHIMANFITSYRMVSTAQHKITHDSGVVCSSKQTHTHAARYKMAKRNSKKHPINARKRYNRKTTKLCQQINISNDCACVVSFSLSLSLV